MRRYSYSSGNTHPVVDEWIELHDDARFEFERNEHSYDYSYVFGASGRWEQSGNEIVLRVEKTQYSSPPDDWRAGSERTTTLVGESLVMDGDTLTLDRATSAKP